MSTNRLQFKTFTPTYVINFLLTSMPNRMYFFVLAPKKLSIEDLFIFRSITNTFSINHFYHGETLRLSIPGPRLKRKSDFFVDKENEKENERNQNVTRTFKKVETLPSLTSLCRKPNAMTSSVKRAHQNIILKLGKLRSGNYCLKIQRRQLI